MTTQYIITEAQLVVLKAAITMGALVIENGTDEEHEAFNKGFDTLQSLPELDIAQPVQPQPLSVLEVEHILAQHNYDVHGDRARYIVRMTEAAHGI